MKSKQEIRQLRDSLMVIVGTPCDCEGLQKLMCVASRAKREALADMLSWVLGEGREQVEEFVQESLKIAAEVHPSRN